MKEQIIAIAKTAKVFLGKNSPTIMTGIGIAGFCTAVILAAKMSPKARVDICEAETAAEDEGKTLEKKEKAVIYIKRYWPVVTTVAASATCIICGQVVQARRTAAATAAYLLAQDSLQTFTKKATEKFGEQSITRIKEGIDKDRLAKAPRDTAKMISSANSGDTLCFDELAGRYFYSSAEKIRKAEADLNKRLIMDNFVPLNAFYDELDLPHIRFGEDLGWDVSLEGCVNVDFSAQLFDNAEPCLVISADIYPRWHV